MRGEDFPPWAGPGVAHLHSRARTEVRRSRRGQPPRPPLDIFELGQRNAHHILGTSDNTSVHG